MRRRAAGRKGGGTNMKNRLSAVFRPEPVSQFNDAAKEESLGHSGSKQLVCHAAHRCIACQPLPAQDVRREQAQSNRMMRINPLVDDPSPKAANVPRGNTSFAPSWLTNEIAQCARVPGVIRVMARSFSTKLYHMSSGLIESAMGRAVESIISATAPPRESNSSSCSSTRTGFRFG